MPVEIITKEDLQVFRIQLLDDIRTLLQSSAAPVVNDRPWLKNAEVCRLLKISASTLQRLRIAGKIRSSKISNRHYYRMEDIEKMVDSERALS